ncbi:GNAT family N-acetyltransferase [Paenibacillus sp. CGMCC 1.16610]|uniref:GNAT family N-acetyltransferase n=1 Tax=Paenibacillus anseongense TaxID=2682845 RepID=A0ABW9UIG9_9BACL|nr:MULTISPECIES: GNAT family protein [Paenibacillus]MBA2941135.1 GNAT family N-acetyltransferase [Paenibacillus sp. CGMCC 1.16610]MVQ39954.1 GNAT family N-acetyltransferase [Paenibacillus anseongense]
MYIRVLEEFDARLYQELRLKALKLSPEAFGSTYEREVQLTLDTFVERIKPMDGKFVLGAFDENGSLVGSVRFVRDTGMKSNHKGNVYGMYVAPEAGGQGLGKKLMLELIRRASSYEGMEQINLIVLSDNVIAKKLYKSLGFEIYGIEHKALKYNGQYFDEDLMVLYI